MLRYDRQTEPGLVALYEIRPANGAGPFLQSRIPHGAEVTSNDVAVMQHEKTLTVLVRNHVSLGRPTGRLQSGGGFRIAAETER